MSFTFLGKRAPLVILDIANNHNGSVEHGKKIIDNVFEVISEFDLEVAVKFQYRNLDSFIHPSFKGNWNYKYIKRFEETRLSIGEFEELISYAKSKDLLVACTPFDEISVDLIERQGIDILKIASVSLTDWPLLNRISNTTLPVVASTAGSKMSEIDKVASFLSKRLKEFALMHCVASYPTPDDSLQLNRIDELKARYSPIPIGYSTHENPRNTDAVKLAVAKGAQILERHVGSKENNNDLNSYSSDRSDLREWLNSINTILPMLDYSTHKSEVNYSELIALQGLRRGVYAKKIVEKGSKLTFHDVYFAIPLQDNQLSANEFSDYNEYIAVNSITENSPLFYEDILVENKQKPVALILESIKSMIEASNLAVPKNLKLEISHHYGLKKFSQFGMVMTTIVNREYCKKLLFLSEGQTNPEHYHKIKEETFYCLFGGLEVVLDNKSHFLGPGMNLTIPIGAKHLLRTKIGAIVEEISTKSIPEDSYYSDPAIQKVLDRKTFATIWV
jgi:sialic acid synthase SpsE/mannose-6-phosphate isomerase-like protein (cupin superfamily)